MIDTASVLNARDEDLLAAWIDGKTPRVRRRGRGVEAGLRFAFYGRVSTKDYQDPVSSRRWQLDVAAELVAGRGRIVAQFFDVGYTRELSWADRPQAAALLAAVADPDRGFDAIVVGEYARAFSGGQIRHVAALLQQHGVRLWLPEADGPIDFEDVTHQALLMLLGAQAKREVQRARFRTTMAMQAQTREHGRYLGGRPPYGYRLVDAGPHPNRAHARWGRRLHRLEPDPETAPHVTWMFAQRLAGHSIAGIARLLNEKGVPCPSAADPERNPHRAGDGWRLRTVAAILANPRYTGRQVWNRQRTDCERTQDELPGLLQVRRLTTGTQWAISAKPTHPGLVSVQDFVAAQAVTALPRPTATSAPTDWSGYCAAGCAGGAWNRSGATVTPATDAGTVTPAPTTLAPAGPPTSTSARTSSSPAPPPNSSSSAAATPASRETSHMCSKPAIWASSSGSCTPTRSPSPATPGASLSRPTRQNSRSTGRPGTRSQQG